MLYNCGSKNDNCYIYSYKDGYVMIDTGYPNAFRTVKKRLEKHDISFNNVRYVFLTHAHDDHAGFLKELLIKYPHIKVICHRDGVTSLATGQNSFKGYCTSLKAYLYCRILGSIGMKNHSFPKIDSFLFDRFIFVDEVNIDIVSKLISAKIILTPGHTLDSISLLYDNNLFCGDMAMNGLWSNRKVNIWIEDRIKLISSWNKIISLNPALIYPGHGKPFRTDELRKNIDAIRNVKMYKLK